MSVTRKMEEFMALAGGWTIQDLAPDIGMTRTNLEGIFDRNSFPLDILVNLIYNMGGDVILRADSGDEILLLPDDFNRRPVMKILDSTTYEKEEKSSKKRNAAVINDNSVNRYYEVSGVTVRLAGIDSSPEDFLSSDEIEGDNSGDKH